MERVTYLSLVDKIQTEADAYVYLERLRWHGMPVCPHCGSIGDHRFLEFANGQSRRTNRGTQTYRRLWKCRDCRKQFSVLTKTIMHGSHVPVRTWVLIIFEMVSNKNGLAAREVERKYGLSPRTAWFVLHRIREATMREPAASLFSGVVISDETWIGGEPRFRHASKRLGSRKVARQGSTEQTPVVSLINEEAGEVRSQVVANVNRRNIGQVIRDNVNVAQSVLHTDGSSVYKEIGPEFHDHQLVNHLIGEYVRARVTTNRVERYFSQLKRSIDGHTTMSARSTFPATWQSSTSATPLARPPTRSAWEC
jgi:transposase-like protein